MRKYQYICFDLDGTLVASGEGIKSSLLSVFRDYNLDAEAIGDLNKFIGPPLRSSFMKYCGFGENEADKVIEDYRKYYFSDGQYRMSLYDGVSDMLRTLYDDGRVLLLITSKLQRSAEEVLGRFGIRRYFRDIFGSMPDNTMTDKTLLIRNAIARLGITDKSSIVMVGDREYDAIGAAGNGISCIGVLYGYGSYRELYDAGTADFADSVADLTMMLLSDQTS